VIFVSASRPARMVRARQSDPRPDRRRGVKEPVPSERGSGALTKHLASLVGGASSAPRAAFVLPDSSLLGPETKQTIREGCRVLLRLWDREW